MESLSGILEWCQGLGSAELRQSQTKFRLTEPCLIQQVWAMLVLIRISNDYNLVFSGMRLSLQSW